jgi:hypothetical protein
LAHWGPRPKGAADLIDNYKRTWCPWWNGKTDLQLWYFHDKGLSTQSEVLDMMLDLDKEEE